MKNLIETILTVTLLTGLPIMLGMCVYSCHTNTIHPDTFDKKQIIKTKQDIDFTNTTQGDRTYEEMLSIEPDYIYYDTTESKRKMDSVDDYMRHWYEVLDTNSDGDIDDTEIKNED